MDGAAPAAAATAEALKMERYHHPGQAKTTTKGAEGRRGKHTQMEYYRQLLGSVASNKTKSKYMGAFSGVLFPENNPPLHCFSFV